MACSEEANPGLFDNLKKASQTNLKPKIAVEEMYQAKRKVPKFYLACGKQDDLMKCNEDFRDFLRSKGADVTWDEKDAGHDWDFWDCQIRKILDWLPL